MTTPDDIADDVPPDLKPCPACGERAIMDLRDHSYRARCPRCVRGPCMATGWYVSESQAAALWNSLPRRADFEVEVEVMELAQMGAIATPQPRDENRDRKPVEMFGPIPTFSGGWGMVLASLRRAISETGKLVDSSGAEVLRAMTPHWSRCADRVYHAHEKALAVYWTELKAACHDMNDDPNWRWGP